jgi:hypothetical protein
LTTICSSNYRRVHHRGDSVRGVASLRPHLLPSGVAAVYPKTPPFSTSEEPLRNSLSICHNFVTAPYAVPDISPIKLFLDNGLAQARPDFCGVRCPPEDARCARKAAPPDGAYRAAPTSRLSRHKPLPRRTGKAYNPHGPAAQKTSVSARGVMTATGAICCGFPGRSRSDHHRGGRPWHPTTGSC